MCVINASLTDHTTQDYIKETHPCLKILFHFVFNFHTMYTYSPSVCADEKWVDKIEVIICFLNN